MRLKYFNQKNEGTTGEMIDDSRSIHALTFPQCYIQSSGVYPVCYSPPSETIPSVFPTNINLPDECRAEFKPGSHQTLHQRSV